MGGPLHTPVSDGGGHAIDRLQSSLGALGAHLLWELEDSGRFWENSASSYMTSSAQAAAECVCVCVCVWWGSGGYMLKVSPSLLFLGTACLHATGRVRECV